MNFVKEKTPSNATLSDGYAWILSLEIDNETYQISDWTAMNGYNFRFTFELWTWQTETDAFGYGCTPTVQSRQPGCNYGST